MHIAYLQRNTFTANMQHTSTHSYIHTCAWNTTHTHTHTHTQTHTHTHTHTPAHAHRLTWKAARRRLTCPGNCTVAMTIPVGAERAAGAAAGMVSQKCAVCARRARGKAASPTARVCKPSVLEPNRKCFCVSPGNATPCAGAGDGFFFKGMTATIRRGRRG
jgi:hypothetical protein